MKKKMFALFLALVLVCALLPVTAAAAGNLEIGGVSVSEGGAYWLTVDGIPTETGASASNYNIHWEENNGAYDLELKNASIKKVLHINGIYSSLSLNLQLSGTNRIYLGDDAGLSGTVILNPDAINTNGDLTIDGSDDSSLSVDFIDKDGNYRGLGLSASGGKFVMNGGNVEIACGAHGIECKEFDLNEGRIKIKVEDEGGIQSIIGINFNGGALAVSAPSNILRSGGREIAFKSPYTAENNAIGSTDLTGMGSEAFNKDNLENYKYVRVGPQVTVTFDAAGGNLVGTSREYISGAEYYDLPAVAREGYVFKGWFTAPEDGTKIVAGKTEMPLEEGTTLYAHWALPPVNNTPVHQLEAPGAETTEENPNTGAEAPISVISAAALLLAAVLISKKR